MFKPFKLGDRIQIGTDDPGYKLSVNGDIQSDFFRGYTYPTNSFLDFDDDQTAATKPPIKI